MLTSPLANQNHRPSPYPYRCLACVSLAWPVQGAKEVEEAEKAGPVTLGLLLDRESPAGEWVLQPLQGVQQASAIEAMLFARLT